MSCPDCDGDLAVFTVPEPLESHAPGAALTVGLCANYLQLHPTKALPSDGVSRPLVGAFPDGGADAAATLPVGMLGSLALSRASIIDYVEFTERSGTDVYLTFDRLQQTATAPHFDVARRQHQLDASP